MTTPAIKPKQRLPVVALVGRVNVGKSTLFNRLIEQHKAIVSDIPGTTRTPNEGIVFWRGKEFFLVDTGGVTFREDVPLEEEIALQSERAAKNADLIVLVTDAKSGVTREDREVAKRLRRAAPMGGVVIAVNKVDREKDLRAAPMDDWLALGFGAPIPVSAANGRNTGDFLDAIFGMLQSGKTRPKKIAEEDAAPIRVALIGKPNVGKSSLFNQLIGEEKVIVSPLPHTTREPHDTLVLYEKQPIVFVDTAGIRRKAQVSEGLESIGVSKSIDAIRTADIVLLVLDGAEPLSTQDLQLGGLLERHAKSALLIINKWDLSDDVSDAKRNEVTRMVYSYFPHLDFAPVLFVSGLTGYRAHQIFPDIIRVWQARHTEIQQAVLDQFLRRATREHRPARGKGTRHPEIHGIRQLGVNPPVFELSIKYRTSVHSSYVKYMENKFREQFDFYGTPVIIKLTKLKR